MGLIRSTAEPSALLEEPLSEHAAALESFLRRASEVREEDWSRPRGPGKWSPAEVTEHVRLSFEVLLAELRDGTAMRIVVPAGKRFVLRRLLLPRIMRTGEFPKGARAPKEVRPTPTSATRADALARLAAAAREFGDACAGLPNPRSRRLTHAYFGGIRVPTVLRFLARHTRHHEKQLAPVWPAAPEPARSSEEPGDESGHRRR